MRRRREDDVGGGIARVVGLRGAGYHNALREATVGAVPEVARTSRIESSVQGKEDTVPSVYLLAKSGYV